MNVVPAKAVATCIEGWGDTYVSGGDSVVNPEARSLASSGCATMTIYTIDVKIAGRQKIDWQVKRLDWYLPDRS